MVYRLGVDVGGTFTDVLLINEADSRFHVAKVPSTPADSSIGVLNGIARVCELAEIQPGANPKRHARYDGRDQRDSNRQGRARGPGHDEGLSPRPCKSPAPSSRAASAPG